MATESSKPAEQAVTTVASPPNASSLSVTLVGAGGCGINLTRPFLNEKFFTDVLYFDTSLTNSRLGESVNTLVDGGMGSGSHRAENARKIESAVPQLPVKELGGEGGLRQVAVVVFGSAGGTGGILGPVLLRHYANEGVRVIAVVVLDTSSAVAASNTLKTLKTLTAIAAKNDIRLPVVFLSNDGSDTRGAINAMAKQIITQIGAMLMTPVYEVDKEDRRNWIDSSKVTGTPPGVKIVRMYGADTKNDTNIVLGTDSTEMVDSMIILQKNDDESPHMSLPPARLRKTGLYVGDHSQLIGVVSSDISSIQEIINKIESMGRADTSQRHDSLEKLKTSGDDELIV